LREHYVVLRNLAQNEIKLDARIKVLCFAALLLFIDLEKQKLKDKLAEIASFGKGFVIVSLIIELS